jgi:hypothetical protein
VISRQAGTQIRSSTPAFRQIRSVSPGSRLSMTTFRLGRTRRIESKTPRKSMAIFTWTLERPWCHTSWVHGFLRTGGSPECKGGFPDRPRRPW